MSDPFSPQALRAVLTKAQGHKYDHGHALMLAGGFGQTGAARMSARAALRIGAGLVTLAAPGAAMLECAAQLTAVMLRRCDSPGDLAGLLDDRRINALGLGPGLGVSRARALLPVALGSGRALVLDADALTALAGGARDLSGPTVLTPHGGEFARLFPDLMQDDAGVRLAAERAGCVVLLKGAHTRIAAPDGRFAVHEAGGTRAVPWLATAGAGDVLAGIVLGLMARSADPFQAACAGAWVHVEAARRLGPGLIAEDLPEALPKVLAAALD